MSEKRAVWIWGSPTLTGKTVHERERDEKPLLYDPAGKPLVEAPRRVGFDPAPPREESKP